VFSLMMIYVFSVHVLIAFTYTGATDIDGMLPQLNITNDEVGDDLDLKKR
jgi:hypothetical protein